MALADTGTHDGDDDTASPGLTGTYTLSDVHDELSTATVTAVVLNDVKPLNGKAGLTRQDFMRGWAKLDGTTGATVTVDITGTLPAAVDDTSNGHSTASEVVAGIAVLMAGPGRAGPAGGRHGA